METKEISYRGGLVTFVIPATWIEEYEAGGGGTFYEPGPDTGTLRINVITAKAPRTITPSSPAEALRIIGTVDAATIQELEDGNAVAKSLSRTSEAGTPITLFSWFVANPVPPLHLRIASFTYTVLSSHEHSPATLNDLTLIESSVRSARFHPTLGE